MGEKTTDFAKELDPDWDADMIKFDFAAFRVRLTDSLKRENLTITQLSERANVSVGRFLQFFESDERPDPVEFYHLYTVLNVTPEYLLGNTNDPKGKIYNIHEYVAAKRHLIGNR